VDAARTIHRHAIREILDKADAGALFTDFDRARYRRDKAFVARLCVQAVNRLFEAGGAGAVLDPDPLQRFHRDAHSASHHAALVWDAHAENFGRQALGLGPSPSALAHGPFADRSAPEQVSGRPPVDGHR
jgi:3-hydroxy-9,10-secoandrosta-1,3,5(10)-triene-9,17-dione monooxygenase